MIHLRLIQTANYEFGIMTSRCVNCQSSAINSSRCFLFGEPLSSLLSLPTEDKSSSESIAL